ncbi:muconolactone Delta-isomerase family protein [Nocardia sp. 2YAB30]|uniref:muconolactone Delta-isomerase family protein n=1 Tax=unclassified Nocardia TaxID=2637762 RepID=UPI003F9B824D
MRGTAPAEVHRIGLWRAADEADLHTNVLDTLPLRMWMSVTVTAVRSHPDDPGKANSAE